MFYGHPSQASHLSRSNWKFYDIFHDFRSEIYAMSLFIVCEAKSFEEESSIEFCL